MSSPQFPQSARRWTDAPTVPSATEAEDNGTRQARPLTISLLRYAPALLLLITAVLDSVQYADTDLWGHVRFGQIMLATHYLIRNEIFSYSAPGFPWTNHEWLSEIMMALTYNSMGVPGLKLMKFLCAGATVLMLAMGLAETGAGTTLQIVVLIAVSVGLQIQVQFRPQLFDYVFSSAILALLAKHRNRRTAPLWLVLPIMVFWANLHGGFLVGIAILGLYTAVTIFLDLRSGRGYARGFPLIGLTLAALIATLINPYGTGLWPAVFHTLRNPLTMHFNTEFQSLPRTLAGLGRSGRIPYPFLFAVVIMAATPASFALAPSWDDLAEVAIAALMICATLYSVRNTAFALIACAAPLAHHLHLWFSRFRRKSQGNAAGKEWAIRMSTGAQAVALTGAILHILKAGEFSRSLPDYTDYPVGAVEFMQLNGLHGNVLCEYAWAVFFIWHESPLSRVFIDSFEVQYPQKVQRDYVNFIHGGSDASVALSGYPTEYVLMRAKSTATRFVSAQPGWPLVYQDPVASLFARAESPAARIPGVPIIRKTAPPSFFP